LNHAISVRLAHLQPLIPRAPKRLFFSATPRNSGNSEFNTQTGRQSREEQFVRVRRNSEMIVSKRSASVNSFGVNSRLFFGVPAH
jgi:hypothetical protein